MRRLILYSFIALLTFTAHAQRHEALDALMERISPGLSHKLAIVINSDTTDFFEITASGDKPEIKANNPISATYGLNRYLQLVAGKQLTWSEMNISLPEVLPLPADTIRGTTTLSVRYYLNYCTLSYSMPYWDERRWQREIDWMALHGINTVLAPVGSEAVWAATLSRIGYPDERISDFIASPTYQAWWLMNNLEGEGAQLSKNQISRQVRLQQYILSQMRALGIEPVLPGYAGMIPSDAAKTLGLNIEDPGTWCSYRRPAFLQPTDTAFRKIADIYYQEQKRLFGTACYYSMDPFHEGGDIGNVEIDQAARKIMDAMHDASPGSTWIIQGWQNNPDEKLLNAVNPSDIMILDLHAESAPQWSGRGHSGHPWVWCSLLNFGGNEGLHGKINHSIATFNDAMQSSAPPSGIGLTMEGIENNELIWELITQLPWQHDINPHQWLRQYARARYGTTSADIDSALNILATTIYNAPAQNRQQGTTESIFCARPTDAPKDVSAWAASEPYYDGKSVIRAAEIFSRDADALKNNAHYIHDLIDFTRQAVAEAGRMEARIFSQAAAAGDSAAYRLSAQRFLSLIELQDTLVGTDPHFRVGRWIDDAKSACADSVSVNEWTRDARRLITVWGNRDASERGQLHDYAHREWQGMLSDFYAKRWRKWFDARLKAWGQQPEAIDFYAFDMQWVNHAPDYSTIATGDPISVARMALKQIEHYR